MYFEKSFLLDLYKMLSSLYHGVDIEAQGGTQFVSELKYFFAADEFKKKMNRACDTQVKSDKDLFIKCVGSMVYLSAENSELLFFTKNFANSFGESKDYNVGSNFFSVNVVKTSMHSDLSLRFPERHAELLSVTKGKIDISPIGYENIANNKDYLGSSIKKFAILFLWLNRYTNFVSKDSIYSDCLKQLKDKYSDTLIDNLKWKDNSVKSEIKDLIAGIELSDEQEFLKKEDFQLIGNLKKPKIEVSENNNFAKNHSQLIYYGVPGCGKSHKVDEIINAAITDKNDREHQVIRVVFHPDYTNADFVGQIMPLVDDGIEYRFKAGPFTRILKHAYKEHSKKFFLVIEELNRGNAAAIFGDLFQLLDREKDGFSTYSINNPDISSFIMSEDDYHNDKILPDSKDVGGDKWILDTPIRLPPNLSILATMNTSDQNVFTLDNAFQRRWKMEYIPNSIKYEDMKDSQKNQYDLRIGETNIKWGSFREKVNENISDSKFSFSNAEDKQLGLFFIKADSETDTAEKFPETDKPEKITESDFANKVLKYLWNDVFKRNLEEIFLAEIKTFGDLLLKFKGSSAFRKCFNSDFVTALEQSNRSLSEQIEKPETSE
ncbi:MAG: AAA family ATPase [Spirochaetales bacterium]|nr:AAA family ATPase [Spirochaetales bacterium]